MSETQTGIGSTRRPTGLPPISLRTALFCFGRMDGRELVKNSSSSSGKEAGAGVSVEELIDIARRHRLDAKLIQVGWPEREHSVAIPEYEGDRCSHEQIPELGPSHLN